MASREPPRAAAGGPQPDPAGRFLDAGDAVDSGTPGGDDTGDAGGGPDEDGVGEEEGKDRGSCGCAAPGVDPGAALGLLAAGVLVARRRG